MAIHEMQQIAINIYYTCNSAPLKIGEIKQERERLLIDKTDRSRLDYYRQHN
jgi:hypothetical protein